MKLTDKTSSARDKLREQVYEYLVEKILKGELKPGDKVSELQLAKTFGISRTPVRDAMHQLYDYGILEMRPNCNPRVAMWSNEKILQLEIVRADLENLAARLAIIYGSNHDFEQMRNYSKACFEAGQKGDIVGQLKGDSLFHNELARISRNEQLIKFIDEVERQVQFLLCWHHEFLVSADKQYKQHEEIVDALMERDEATAIKRLTHHTRHFMNMPELPLFPAEFFYGCKGLRD